MQENILEIKNLNLYFNVKKKEFQSLFDINISLKKGEFIGIIGESGSGKTQTVMSILGLSPENSKKTGNIIFKDKDLTKLEEPELNKIRGNNISIAFQDSSLSLNPYMRVGDQLIEPLVLHKGKTVKEAEKEIIEILKNLEIRNAEKAINKYPNEFSGGQRQRFLIAMALSCKPEVFIADELTTSLDHITQTIVLNYIDQLRKEYGMSVLFISHDLRTVSKFVDKIIVMYCGHILEESECKEFFNNTLHPYSNGLIDLIPKINDRGNILRTIPGEIPQLNELRNGCPFYNRCKYCFDKCLYEKPKLTDFNGHKVACFKNN